MSELSGKTVLVVGGSSGIGLAIGKMAGRDGASVMIASRSRDKLDAAAAGFRHEVSRRVIDVTDDLSVDAFFAGLPAFDHVFVTAADVTIKPVREIDIATAQAAMNSKFWGIFRIAKAARIVPGGSLGFVSGFRSMRPGPGLALMSAVNGAIEGLTRGLALDLRPVRVNAVSPAMVDTPLWSGLEREARDAMIRRLSEQYPAGVVGRAEDVAAALLMLATNPYATGTVMVLDGGASLV